MNNFINTILPTQMLANFFYKGYLFLINDDEHLIYLCHQFFSFIKFYNQKDNNGRADELLETSKLESRMAVKMYFKQ
jgi:hypothetical protein